MMNGIINLMKPPCMSSAQAVAFIKRLTKLKVGHAGTLDPEAAGVLPIMIGKATRLFDFLTEREKIYVAEVAFGTSTDTQDASGRVVASSEKVPTAQQVVEALEGFHGTVQQVPPSFSAIKRDGKALYELARQGELVELDARPVDIYHIEHLRQTSLNNHLIRVWCGKGTYIRTLCHDLGTALGIPAHMRMLIREQSGRFHIHQSITLEAFQEALAEGRLSGEWLVSPETAVDHLPRVHVTPDLLQRCMHGVALSQGQWQEKTPDRKSVV